MKGWPSAKRKGLTSKNGYDKVAIMIDGPNHNATEAYWQTRKNDIKRIEIGKITIAIKVIVKLMLNIIINIPIMVTKLLIKEVAL